MYFSVSDSKNSVTFDGNVGSNVAIYSICSSGNFHFNVGHKFYRFCFIKVSLLESGSDVRVCFVMCMKYFVYVFI